MPDPDRTTAAPLVIEIRAFLHEHGRDDLARRLDALVADNTRLREALTAVFLDPLGSHGASAVARNALGIPHIPFATPEQMLAAHANPVASPRTDPQPE